MSDTVKALIVTLEDDMRDEDVTQLQCAIAWMKHVISVDKSVVTMDDLINRVRIRRELVEKLWKVLETEKKG